MKDCRKIRDLLSPYLENEVGADERLAVEGHLAGCGDCRRELELLRHTVGALKSTPDLPPPADIMAAVRREMAPARSPGLFQRIFGGRPWIGLPAGALAVALVGIAALVLQNRYPDLPEKSHPVPPAERPAMSARGDVPVADEKAAPVKEEVAAVEEKVIPAEPRPARPPTAPPTAGVPKQRPVEAESAPPGPAPSAAEMSPPVAAPPAERQPLPADDKRAPVPAVEGYLNTETGFAEKAAPIAPAPPDVPPDVRTDSYRETPAEAAKDVQRLLESSDLLSPPGRDGNGETAAAVGDRRRAPPRAGLEELVGTAYDGGRTKKKALTPEREDRRAHLEDGNLAGEILGKTKSVPPRGRSAEPAALQSEEALRVPAMRQQSAAAPDEGFTVVLTLLAGDGDATGAVRRHLRETGGQVLELRSLDGDASRELVQRLGLSLPPGRSFSRGWHIRALVPADEVERFISRLEKEPDYNIVAREHTPATRRPAPGIRGVEVQILN